MARPIDPVVIREKQDRQRKRAAREHLTQKALGALAWFSSYAFGNTTHYEGDEDGQPIAGTGVRQVNPNALVGENGLGSRKVPALLVATSTSGVEEAGEYVNRAFIEMRSAILDRAIEMAQADLDANEVREEPL